MNVELNGKRMQAAVLEKKQATEKYEKAIDEGDTPVLVEKSAGGLYTANLGNLMAGEEAVIEFEYAQLLHFEQGRIRLSIPTTIAPRFGDAHRQGGLAAHETDSVDPLVEYPFTLKLDVCGQVAKANLRCPSHKVNIAAMDGGMSVRLEQGAMLDRDFILSLDGLEGQCFAVTAPDGDQYAVLASFCPKLPAQEESPLLLKIPVDCSGSMGGDSIAQARTALHELFQHLSPADRVSYSKFGSTVEHVVAKMERCTSRFVGRVLAPALKATDANLGGTETNTPPLSTFEIKAPQDTEQDSNVLLITDGDVWHIDAVLASACKSAHRIFVVGVSSAPAESLLCDLGEKTGGACELVSPNENIANAIIRMFKRMRAAKAVDMQVDWGGTPLWQSRLPRQLFDGETVHVFTQLASPPTAAPSLRWQTEGQCGQAQADALGIGALRTVARVVGARRMVEAPSSEESLALALKYQLVSAQTNLILVHVRADGEKASGLPALQQIDQMLAAGWGGFGSVLESTVRYSRGVVARGGAVSSQPDYASMATPSAWRTGGRTNAVARVDALASGGMVDFEIPAFLRKQAVSYQASEVTPAELLDLFNDAALVANNFSEAHELVQVKNIGTGMTTLLASVSKDAGDLTTASALLLDWLATQLAGVADDVKLSAAKSFAAALPDIDSENWGTARLPESAQWVGST